LIIYFEITKFKGEKIMKPIFKEFYCPQCGGIRRLNVNGICFDCRNENMLILLAEQRKKQHKLRNTIPALKVENYF
jgi:hypothetical protein